MHVGRSQSHQPLAEAVGGLNGVVSTAHPYATMAAINAMQSGGTAVDAVISAGAVLTVVMPWAGQLGGDCFLLIREPDGSVAAVNGSGAAPDAATYERFSHDGGAPEKGWLVSTVPGIVAGWHQAHQRFGRLPWRRLFQAATGYAADGFVVTRTFRDRIVGARGSWEEFPETTRVFFPGGAPPEQGTVFCQPDLAGTLEAIASGGSEAFYTGEIADSIVRSSLADGGLITESDLGTHSTPTPAPIEIGYRGATVYAQPPVSQGIVLLMALGTLEELDSARHEPFSADSVHLQVEAIKLAFLDRLAHLGDPAQVSVPVDDMLSARSSRRRAGDVDFTRASDRLGELSASADTTSLVAADKEGRVVTYLHSLYTSSGVVIPGTGIMMNSRLLGFSLDPNSPNALAPGKRPVHTLNAALVVNDVDVYGLCTPGAHLQVQHNLQVLTHLIDHHLEMEAAVDAPRWSLGDPTTIGGLALQMEDRFGREVLDDLAHRGHLVNPTPSWAVGAMQLVRADQARGTLWAAHDPRHVTSLAAAR